MFMMEKMKILWDTDDEKMYIYFMNKISFQLDENFQDFFLFSEFDFNVMS